MERKKGRDAGQREVTNGGKPALVACKREDEAEERGGDAKRTLGKAPDGHRLGGEQKLCKVLARVVLERRVCGRCEEVSAEQTSERVRKQTKEDALDDEQSRHGQAEDAKDGGGGTGRCTDHCAEE